jgi:hypothetical protein
VDDVKMLKFILSPLRLPFRHTGNRRNHFAEFKSWSAGRTGGRRNIDLFTVVNAADRRKQAIRARWL